MGQTQGQTELLGASGPQVKVTPETWSSQEVLTGTALSPAEQGKLNPFAEGDPTQGSTWNPAGLEAWRQPWGPSRASRVV